MNISYVVSVLLALMAFIALMKDWKQHHQAARWVLGVLILLLLAASVTQTRRSQQSHQAELAKSQKEATAQTDLLKQMQVKNQDLEARIIAQDERTRALTACIPDPEARKQAQAIGPKFSRQPEAHIGFRAEATARAIKAHK
jgi:hypothetical protein